MLCRSVCLNIHMCRLSGYSPRAMLIEKWLKKRVPIWSGADSIDPRISQGPKCSPLSLMMNTRSGGHTCKRTKVRRTKQSYLTHGVETHPLCSLFLSPVSTEPTVCDRWEITRSGGSSTCTGTKLAPDKRFLNSSICPFLSMQLSC